MENKIAGHVKAIEEHLKEIWNLCGEMDTSLKDICWGYDDEGDFGLRIGKTNIVFYKWANPIFIEGDFEDLTDITSKPIWKKLRKDV